MWKFSSELLHFSTFENLTVFFGVKKVDFLELSEVQKSTRFFSDGLYFSNEVWVSFTETKNIWKNSKDFAFLFCFD